jgi:hypothetical protein
LIYEGILFEIAIVNGISDPLAVRRDLRAAGCLQRQEIVNRGNARLGECRRNKQQKR